jgi:hypothetical protein
LPKVKTEDNKERNPEISIEKTAYNKVFKLILMQKTYNRQKFKYLRREQIYCLQLRTELNM